MYLGTLNALICPSQKGVLRVQELAVDCVNYGVKAGDDRAQQVLCVAAVQRLLEDVELLDVGTLTLVLGSAIAFQITV